MINGILLLYYHPPVNYAPTVMEHIDAFPRYSQFKVWAVNTHYGYPKCLDNMKFRTIVFHYSLFGSANYMLSAPFYRFLSQNPDAYKIVVWQDECYNVKQRTAFLNNHKVDCVYSCLDQKYFDEVYYSRCPSVKKVLPTLTGYVGEYMLKMSDKFFKPYLDRTIDVGYRTREVPTYLGLGGLEKIEIAQKFQAHANGTRLRLDIKYKEADRLYGNKYWKWLSNCRAILGAESGGSIFDLDNEVWDEYHRRLGNKARIRNYMLPYDQMPADLMNKWENKISYRAISPRYFEAAAFNICQVLYPGKYNGILIPWVHYLPLERDFSNFQQIIEFMKGAKGRAIRANAYKDLIESGRYSFQKFIESFDAELIKEGLSPSIDDGTTKLISKAIVTDVSVQKLKHAPESILYALYYNRWFGKELLVPMAQPLGEIYFKLRGYKKGVTQ